jgi:hypothetical protein
VHNVQAALNCLRCELKRIETPGFEWIIHRRVLHPQIIHNVTAPDLKRERCDAEQERQHRQACGKAAFHSLRIIPSTTWKRAAKLTLRWAGVATCNFVVRHQ